MTDRLKVPGSPLATVLIVLTRVCLLLVMVQMAPKLVPSKLPEMVRLALLTVTYVAAPPDGDVQTMVAVDSQPAVKASVTVTCRTPVLLSGNVTVWLALDARMKFVGVTAALGLATDEKLKVCVVLAGLVRLVILMYPCTIKPTTKPAPLSMHLALVPAVKFAGVQSDDDAFV